MTSGSILRGSLRPGSGRTPPFLIIGLLVICGILGYNYWNLSAEYDALVKEIGALQDKFRIVALKREHAEKQSDAVERRFNEAESEIGKIKISVFQKDQELTKAGAKIESQNVELENLRDQIKACQALNVQINTSKDKLEDLRKKLDVSNTEKEQLQGEKQKLITERQDMRLKLEELTFKLAHFTQQRDNYLRPEPPVPPVSAKQHPGQLKLLDPSRVQLMPKGMNGFSLIRPGGPLLSDDDEVPQMVEEPIKNTNTRNRVKDNESNVIPAPRQEPLSVNNGVNDGNVPGVLPLPEVPGKNT